MYKWLSFLLCLGFLLIFNTQPYQYKVRGHDYMAYRKIPKPPIAKVIPYKTKNHGDIRIDNYHWLRDDKRQRAEILAYLKAENNYTDGVMKDTEDFRDKLFNEIKGRIKKDDSSVPYKQKDFWYYSRFEKDKEYPIYCRKRGSLQATEQIILDVNQMAKDFEFYDLNNWEISSEQNIIAFAEDTVSRRLYNIRFKNLETGELYPEKIINTSSAMAWANDNKTLFYARKHPETLLVYQIYRHELDSDPANDVLVYEEDDETFNASVYKTKSNDYIVILLSQTLSNEILLLHANEPEGKFKVFLPREREHEYNIVHDKKRFLIRTNWKAQNFRLMEVPINRIGNKHSWKELISHRKDILLEEIEVFKDNIVVAERSKGLLNLRIIDKKNKRETILDFEEPVYSTYIYYNPEYNTSLLRYGYSSLTTPDSVYEYNMVTGKKKLLKQDEVLGGFDSSNYISERIYVPSRDGKKIPVSMVYREGFVKDGTAPFYLTGYGSYGYSYEPSFTSHILSLLDRGFVYGIAHVRGGEEMGRSWYEDGKMFNKKHTFNDFIDVTEFIIKEKYGDKNNIFAMGGSAGGLLMGAVVNMRPDLYKAVIAHVPFVDVISTMLDESIPLTTGEFDEWGNPKNKDSYFYMLSYSPYDKVEAQDYPHMLVTTGLYDSQVQYWEPAKWVARLRAIKTDNNILLLHTNMESGHGGASGRFRPYKEKALEYAFIFDLLGIMR